MAKAEACSLNTVRSKSGKTQVVRGVIHGMLQGRWRGGDRLTETEAAELFAVSRTPVREGLLELAAMGLIELRRNCGAVFLPFGGQELKDLYAVRSLLEVEATRLAAARIELATVEGLIAKFQQLHRTRQPDRDWVVDRELHHTIAQASGNPRLEGEISRYSVLVQTMREVVGKLISDVHSPSQSDHLKILRHLRQRQAEAAAEAMREHLERAAESAVEALQRLRRNR
jgi:DNA-binding GntR family transcriptional regulator